MLATEWIIISQLLTIPSLLFGGFMGLALGGILAKFEIW
jgi:hypothetical protein|tara:strand:+ start:665 stop:781 length:117 start_codon:yes stop_codon:yes gene_type:complete